MGKRLFLLIIGGLIGVIMSPQGLTAADKIVLMQPDFDAVETIEPVVEETVVAKPVVMVRQASPSQTNQPINYTVTVYTSDIQEHNLSYADIYKTEKLIYAHNSTNLLGSLKTLNLGDVFYITEPSGVKAYKVMKNPTYNKTMDDGLLEHNPNLMRSIVHAAMGYDVALMTCAGEPIGAGDATQRLVVFANEV